jgi:hypothetical protein
MKKGLLIFIIYLITFQVNAQFEQKISINVASGIFKTFGKKLGQYDPMQMPNYRMGFSANGGLQFKISERFSLSADFGIMISQKWSYKAEGSDNNYLYWSFTDETTGISYEGEAYMDIYNYSLGIKPKFYLSPGNKLNPYLFAGVNINWTRAWFEDTQWTLRNELNYFPGGYYDPSRDFLEENFGIGFNPGFGVEYSPNDRIHLYLEPGYYFIMLNKKSFMSPERVENFNAFILTAGLRYFFIKSKDL